MPASDPHKLRCQIERFGFEINYSPNQCEAECFNLQTGKITEFADQGTIAASESLREEGARSLPVGNALEQALAWAKQNVPAGTVETYEETLDPPDDEGGAGTESEAEDV